MNCTKSNSKNCNTKLLNSSFLRVLSPVSLLSPLFPVLSGTINPPHFLSGGLFAGLASDLRHIIADSISCVCASKCADIRGRCSCQRRNVTFSVFNTDSAISAVNGMYEIISKIILVIDYSLTCMEIYLKSLSE
ncbi:hypothetical protein J6590_065330 [Homalodisca vitripennis]|nr:hypothetical protein J6590_065330 [Homalodisca vitripennis]